MTEWLIELRNLILLRLYDSTYYSGFDLASSLLCRPRALLDGDPAALVQSFSFSFKIILCRLNPGQNKRHWIPSLSLTEWLSRGTTLDYVLNNDGMTNQMIHTVLASLWGFMTEWLIKDTQIGGQTKRFAQLKISAGSMSSVIFYNCRFLHIQPVKFAYRTVEDMFRL